MRVDTPDTGQPVDLAAIKEQAEHALRDLGYLSPERQEAARQLTVYAFAKHCLALVERLERAERAAKTAKARAAAPDYDEEAIRDALWATVDAAFGDVPKGESEKMTWDQANAIEAWQTVARKEERVAALSRLLLDVEASLLAYWTDLPELEIQRLLPLIRDALVDFAPVGETAAETEQQNG